MVSTVHPAVSPRAGASECFSTPRTLDDEVVRYARWISSQAAVAGGVEQKLIALSRRAAAELRKAERERGELAARLGLLEACCWRAGILSRDDCVPASRSAPSAPPFNSTDGGVKSCEESRPRSLDSLTQHVQVQCISRLEAALAQERQSLGEQLATKCGELQARLDGLHKEFAEKHFRSAAEASGPWAQPSPVLAKQLKEEIHLEVGRLHALARDEARIVHHEVMSLDARVALLEERGAGQLGLGSLGRGSQPSSRQDTGPGTEGLSMSSLGAGGASVGLGSLAAAGAGTALKVPRLWDA